MYIHLYKHRYQGAYAKNKFSLLNIPPSQFV